MKMMSTAMTGTFVSSQNNQPYVKTIASSNEKEISILLMNQHLSQSFNFEVISGGKEEADNSNELKVSLSTEVDINLKGKIKSQTSLLLQFDSKGKLIKSINYSLTDNLQNLEPNEF
jgi:hypothetical protein